MSLHCLFAAPDSRAGLDLQRIAAKGDVVLCFGAAARLADAAHPALPDWLATGAALHVMYSDAELHGVTHVDPRVAMSDAGGFPSPGDRAGTAARVALGPEKGSEPACNDEGFLLNVDAWNPEVAVILAAREGVALTDAHWEILHLLRDFYRAFDSSPAMRALVKYTRQRLGEDKGRSIYLLRLFPGSPAKIGSKIAGLPRPANCL